MDFFTLAFVTYFFSTFLLVLISCLGGWRLKKLEAKYKLESKYKIESTTRLERLKLDKFLKYLPIPYGVLMILNISSVLAFVFR